MKSEAEKKFFTTKRVVVIGIFSSIAFLFQVIGSMIGIKVSGFLEVEFSDLPALIISMAYGPLAGLFVEFIKNLLHSFVTTTGFVGEFANFIVNGSFCVAAGLIYKYKKTFKTAIVALVLGVFIMVITGFFANLFIMLPLYMPTADFTSRINLVLTTIVPFNFVRGLILALITTIIYKRISKAIK